MFQMLRICLALALFGSLTACGVPKAAAPSAATPLPIASQLNALLAGPVAQIATAATAGNKDQATQGFADWESGWSHVEDDVKKQSPENYQAIENAMNQLQDVTVRANKTDQAAVQQAVVEVTKAINGYVNSAK